MTAPGRGADPDADGDHAADDPCREAVPDAQTRVARRVTGGAHPGRQDVGIGPGDARAADPAPAGVDDRPREGDRHARVDDAVRSK